MVLCFISIEFLEEIRNILEESSSQTSEKTDTIIIIIASPFKTIQIQ